MTAVNEATPLPQYLRFPSADAGGLVAVRPYTATTVSQCDALPDSWRGQYARATARGGNVSWFLTRDPAAVATATTPSAAGTATATGGAYYSNGYGDDGVLTAPGDGTLYLCRIADSDSASLEIRLR